MHYGLLSIKRGISYGRGENTVPAIAGLVDRLLTIFSQNELVGAFS